MVRLAIAGNPRFVLDDRECRRAGPSYTVDTLNELRGELGPERPLMLIMGEDAYRLLESWSRWAQLFDLAHIVVAARPGFSLVSAPLPPALARETVARQAQSAADLSDASHGRVLAADTTQLPISATQIRAALESGHSARYLLPQEVLAYIESHRLYKETDAG
jgi:nicotinate-nucleotide adenylyltransferase